MERYNCSRPNKQSTNATVGGKIPYHDKSDEAMLLRKERRRDSNRRSTITYRAKKRQMTEKMIEETEEMRQKCRILAEISDLVISVDMNGIINYVSREACQIILQRDADKLIDTSVYDLCTPSCHETVTRLLNRRIEPFNMPVYSSRIDSKIKKYEYQIKSATADVAEKIRVDPSEKDDSMSSLSAEKASSSADSIQSSTSAPSRSTHLLSYGSFSSNSDSDTSLSKLTVPITYKSKEGSQRNLVVSCKLCVLRKNDIGIWGDVRISYSKDKQNAILSFRPEEDVKGKEILIDENVKRGEGRHIIDIDELATIETLMSMRKIPK